MAIRLFVRCSARAVPRTQLPPPSVFHMFPAVKLWLWRGFTRGFHKRVTVVLNTRRLNFVFEILHLNVDLCI